MKITMRMDVDELQKLIDDACYEEFASEKEPELQTITIFTKGGAVVELTRIDYIEIKYIS